MPFTQHTISTIAFLIAICLTAPSFAISSSAAKQMGHRYDRLVVKQAYLYECAPEARNSKAWRTLNRKIHHQQNSLKQAIRYYNTSTSTARAKHMLKQRARAIYNAAKYQVNQRGCDSVAIRREIQNLVPRYAISRIQDVAQRQ